MKCNRVTSMRLLDLLQVFQDQENIIVPIMFSWGEKLFFPYSHTHEDIREFESILKLFGVLSQGPNWETKCACQQGLLWQGKTEMYYRLTCKRTSLSTFVIWFMTC